MLFKLQSSFNNQVLSHPVCSALRTELSSPEYEVSFKINKIEEGSGEFFPLASRLFSLTKS